MLRTDYPAPPSHVAHPISGGEHPGRDGFTRHGLIKKRNKGRNINPGAIPGPNLCILLLGRGRGSVTGGGNIVGGGSPPHFWRYCSILLASASSSSVIISRCPDTVLYLCPPGVYSGRPLGFLASSPLRLSISLRMLSIFFANAWHSGLLGSKVFFGFLSSVPMPPPPPKLKLNPEPKEMDGIKEKQYSSLYDHPSPPPDPTTWQSIVPANNPVGSMRLTGSLPT